MEGPMTMRKLTPFGVDLYCSVFLSARVASTLRAEPERARWQAASGRVPPLVPQQLPHQVLARVIRRLGGEVGHDPVAQH